MPRVIYRVGYDQYIEFSTVVDAPVTHVMTKGGMAAYLLREGQNPYDIRERLERCDETFCSMRIPGYAFGSAEAALADLIEAHNLNRSEDEHLTVDGFWLEYGR